MMALRDYKWYLTGILITLFVILSHWPGVLLCISERLNTDVCTILGKTTWEWLDLLVAPAILAFFGILSKEYFDSQAKKRADREKEEQNSRLEQDKYLAQDKEEQESLKSYFNEISQKLVDENWPQRLSNNEQFQDAKPKLVAIVQAMTLAILDELNGKRERFCY
jgi:hypothetical protein